MWVAGWNMPGCLPEMDPARFDDWEDASAFIRAELETLEPNEWAEIDVAAYALSEWDKEPVNDHRLILIFPYLYWIERSNARDT